jgi:hypothetical protein
MGRSFRRGAAIAAVVAGAGCGGQALTAAGESAVASDQAPADGRCDLTPRLLVAASTYPVPQNAGPVKVDAWGLTVSGADLYYETYAIETSSRAGIFLAGALLHVPVGGGLPAELATNYVLGTFIVSDTSLIVERDNAWPNMNADDVVSIPRAGGDPTSLFTFDVNDVPLAGPVTDGTFVYVSSATSVRAISLASPAQVTTVAMPQEAASGIAVLNGHLVMTFPQGDVKSLPVPLVANAAPTLVASGLPAGPGNVMRCGESVCWIAGGAIEKLDPLGGSVKTVATLGGFFGAAFDGTSFFIVGSSSADEQNHVLERLPAAGGKPTVLGTFHGGGALAVDDECLYWSSAQGIFSRAKTASGSFEQ